MTVISQPGKWNVRIVPGGAIAGPCLCLKAWCFPCWGLGNLAAMREFLFIKKKIQKNIRSLKNWT